MTQVRMRRRAPLTSPIATLLVISGLVAASPKVHASENYRSRQLPLNTLGAETLSPLEESGFVASAMLTAVEVQSVADDRGHQLATPALAVPLPTATHGLPIPDGTYALDVPAEEVRLKQGMSVLNLLAGYTTHDNFGGGKFILGVNLPYYARDSRSMVIGTTPGTVNPTPSPALPSAALAGISAIASAANTAVQSRLAAQAAANNDNVSGFGDADLGAYWVRHINSMRLLVGGAVTIPTGSYKADRAVNPGFGQFYTFRPSVTLIDDLNGSTSLAAKATFGYNTRNRGTDYRSGNFLVFEGLAVTKLPMNFAVGANVSLTQQIQNDSAPTGVAVNGHYVSYCAGPFLARKVPGIDGAFNLQINQNFGSRNALVARTVNLRFVRQW